MADKQGHLQALIAATTRAGRPASAPRADTLGIRSLAALFTGVSVEARGRDVAIERLVGTLGRIANLQVRGAAELIEGGDWKAIAAELQTIAQDALGTLRTAPPPG